MAESRSWNPLRSEQEAFELLIGAILFFAAIVVASVLGGVWAGVAVFVVLSAAVVAWFVRRNRHPEPAAPVGSRETPAHEHRVVDLAAKAEAGARAEGGTSPDA